MNTAITTTSHDSAPQTSRWFSIFCLIHIAIFTALPALVRPQLAMDSVEGMAWGNRWQWGYSKHPFLAPWLTALFPKIFHAVDWPVYFVSQLTIIVCFFAIWRLARLILTPIQALISVVLLDSFYFYHTGAFEFNPNIVMLATWALTTLFFYRAATTGKWLNWILAGAMAGLTMDTKYESLVLFAALFLFLLYNPESRQALKTAKPYVAALVALVVFMPNLIWLLQHNFIPVHYADSELDSHATFFTRHFLYAFRFFYENIGLLVGMFILAVPLYFCKQNKDQTITPFDQQFLWIVGLGPFILTLFFSAIGGFFLVSRWSYPFFSLMGVLLVAVLKPVIETKHLLRFFSLYASLVVILVISYAIYIQKTTTAYSNLFPGRGFAQSVEKIWHAHYPTHPLIYVSGFGSPVYYLASYAKPQAIPYFEWNRKKSPWINEKIFREKGAMFIYPGLHFPPSILKRYPNLTVLPVHYFKANYSRKKMITYPMSIAILPPGSP